MSFTPLRMSISVARINLVHPKIVKSGGRAGS